MAFDRRKTAWESGFVSPSLFGVRADNISPMTVTGTNTFIVHTPGTPKALVVDPGPADVRHLARVLDAVHARGAEIAAILATHTHADHIGGTDLLLHLIAHGPASIDPKAVPAPLDGRRFDPRAFGRRARASFDAPTPVPVFAKDLGNCPPGPFEPFDGCPRLTLVDLPGHCDDMVGLLIDDEHIVLTGDLIFRYWSSVVPYGDGNLADYFASLDTLQQLVRNGSAEEFAPAHGFPIDQPIKALEGYRAHRRQRLEQVRRVVSETGFDPLAVVRSVYGDITDSMLLKASLAGAFAQLEYLAAERGVEFTPDASLLSLDRATVERGKG